MKRIYVLTGVKNEPDFLGDDFARVDGLAGQEMSATVKLGMALTTLIGVLFIYSAWARVERNYGRAQAQAEYTAIALAADQAARAKEQSMQAQIAKAQNDAQTRQKTLEAAAAGAARAVVSLRSQLSASRAALPVPADAPSVDYSAASDAVLSECSAELVRVAKAADGHASDAVMLLEAWPK